MRRNKESWLIHLIIILFCIPCVAAFLIVVSVSLSKEKEILKNGYSFLPRNLDFTSYRYVFENSGQIIRSYFVTGLSTLMGTMLSVLLMAMLAYSLSRQNFKLRTPLSFMVFFTMLFSGGLVPSYILVTQYLHLADTFLILLLSGLINAWHVILLKTFFKSIESALIESAKIDGASEYRILFEIVMPVARPAIATIALLGSLARWNDWFTCMLYIRNEHLLTLQYLLQRIMLNAEMLKSGMINIPAGLEKAIKVPEETVRMAMVVIATGPMLFVFPFFQKYFVKGIMVGSVK